VTNRGGGIPLVLIPGIQGRWEWMAPAVRALGRRGQVLTFSLGEERPPHLFDRWTARVDALIDGAGATEAAVVGISFGGLVAAWYASRRPGRTARLVLVSTPSPAYALDARSAAYVRYPRLSLPFFASRAVGRLLPEVVTALPTMGARARFGAAYAGRAVRYPVSPTQMAAVVREWEHTDLTTACRTVSAPTLVVTGEPHLDRVVPVASTLEFLRLIPGARHVTLARTGHVGFLSRPDEFAALVSDFVETGAGPAASRDAGSGS
jgi:pimeloyl-ACP methyl ester carboxylesterase